MALATAVLVDSQRAAKASFMVRSWCCCECKSCRKYALHCYSLRDCPWDSFASDCSAREESHPQFQVGYFYDYVERSFGWFSHLSCRPVVARSSVGQALLTCAAHPADYGHSQASHSSSQVCQSLHLVCGPRLGGLVWYHTDGSGKRRYVHVVIEGKTAMMFATTWV